MFARAFWPLILGFLAGVFVRTFFAIGWSLLGFGILVAGALVFFAFSHRKYFDSRVLLISIALLSFLLGGGRTLTAVPAPDSALEEMLGKHVEIEGIVSDEPDVRENGIRIPLRPRSIDGVAASGDALVLVIVPAHTEVAYGDHILASGVLNLPKSFDTGTGRVFNYPAFLAKDGILYELDFARSRSVGENEGNIFKSYALRSKQKFIDGLSAAISEPAAGLAGGITVGDKRGLGKELSETFRTVGLTHIIVLSGYNIMVVIGCMMRYTTWLPKPFRLTLGALVALFFAAITGFAAASTRAAAMATIAIVGQASGRTYLASRALALVAFAMVLWNPLVLAFDPGFQLSILATLGLIFVSPIFEARFTKIPKRFGLREISATTLGTQLTVLPLLLFQNGTMSLVAFPANLLALVAVPWAMALSALAAVFGLIAGPLAPVFGFPAYVLLSYIVFVAKSLAAVPFSAISIPAFSIGWMFGAYALLIFIVSRMQKKSAKPKASR